MRSWPRAVHEWGSTAAERAAAYPCDALLDDPDDVLFRAVGVRAPAPALFRWLCQLRAAPYSYDLLDNRGRRSPQQLTPGLEQLEAGQRVMQIFRLASFEPGRSLTLRSRGPVFGDIACSYVAEPAGADASRLIVKLLVRRPRRRLVARTLGALLPAGDLVMMRRQLLNLKALAEGRAS